MTYAEQLQDPRWLAKREEIIERDDYHCQGCCARDVVFDIHHKMYIKDRMAWQYPNEYLVTLCRFCHEDITEWKKEINNIIDKHFVNKWRLYGLLKHISEYAKTHGDDDFTIQQDA